jgi:hypothetical protein
MMLFVSSFGWSYESSRSVFRKQGVFNVRLEGTERSHKFYRSHDEEQFVQTSADVTRTN